MCRLVLMAQGIGTTWGTAPGQTIQVALWHQSMAHSLRKEDVGIQCELVYDSVSPAFSSIQQDGFNSKNGVAFCYLYEVIDEDLMIIERKSELYEAQVQDVTDQTFTISLSFPIEDF